ncbi:MAG TPA: hypothetical protein VL400_25705, partial [Polyangiaceae bacterium]|nr:hypothetical protein [Polyangiaceae bacterium]
AAARLRDRSLGLARRFGLRLPGDVGASLESLAERGVGLHFLFASGEPGLALLESRAGASVEKLSRAGRLELTIVEGPDHTFTARWAQDALGARLDAHFARAATQSGRIGAPAHRE